jgi:hypothetical protein
MKLTIAEIKEQQQLEEIKHSSSRLMTQEQWDRLSFLRKKEFLNCCFNPKCTGYEGSDSETICPICNSKLFK